MAARFHVDPVDWYQRRRAGAPPSRHRPRRARPAGRGDALRKLDWRARLAGRAARPRAEGRRLVSGRARRREGHAPSGSPTSSNRPSRRAALSGRRISICRLSGRLARAASRRSCGRASPRCAPRRVGLKRLAELGAYAAEAVAAAGGARRRRLDAAHLPVETEERAALALLGIGPEIEVLEPAVLRATGCASWRNRVLPRARRGG